MNIILKTKCIINCWRMLFGTQTFFRTEDIWREYYKKIPLQFTASYLIHECYFGILFMSFDTPCLTINKYWLLLSYPHQLGSGLKGQVRFPTKTGPWLVYPVAPWRVYWTFSKMQVPLRYKKFFFSLYFNI